jgi:hypothetical protein
VVYDRATAGIIVLAVLNQARDSDRIIAELGASLPAERDALRG